MGLGYKLSAAMDGVRLKFLFAFLLCSFACVPTFAASSPDFSDQQWVRVRLQSHLQQVHIEGRALQFQNKYQPYQSVAIPQGDKSLDIQILEQGGHKMWSLTQHSLGSSQTFVFSEPYLLIQGQDLHQGAQRLPSKVFLSFAPRKEIDLIGVIPLEDYITGVLASEMPLSWPLETLKAQAVAVRSYTLAVMRERQSKPFQLESSILDQVFRPLVTEDKTHPLIQKAVLAVEQTRGVKLLTAQQKVLKAYYHSDCGGKTTNAQNVWGQASPTEVVVDDFCASNPKTHWSFAMSQNELEEKLRKVFPGAAASVRLQSLSLIQPAHEERVQKVAVVLADGRHLSFSANEFRGLLGYDRLRSSLFEMNKSDQGYVFTGKGFGHGVGLCQWGSRALGLKGWSYQAILRHYYPRAQIKTGASLGLQASADSL